MILTVLGLLGMVAVTGLIYFLITLVPKDDSDDWRHG